MLAIKCRLMRGQELLVPGFRRPHPRWRELRTEMGNIPAQSRIASTVELLITLLESPVLYHLNPWTGHSTRSYI